VRLHSLPHIAGHSISAADDSARLEIAKRNLLDAFEKKYDLGESLYVCPESLTTLSRSARSYGLSSSAFYQSTEFPTNQYPIKPQYVDFTIKGEQDKPIWSQSVRERIGQSFFQNPIISGVYERGYRQNFQNAGFPGTTACHGNG